MTGPPSEVDHPGGILHPNAFLTRPPGKAEDPAIGGSEGVELPARAEGPERVGVRRRESSPHDPPSGLEGERSVGLPGPSAQLNPIHRPAAATVNHSAIDAIPSTRLFIDVSSLSSHRSRTAKVKTIATGSVVIFTQKAVL